MYVGQVNLLPQLSVNIPPQLPEQSCASGTQTQELFTQLGFAGSLHVAWQWTTWPHPSVLSPQSDAEQFTLCGTQSHAPPVHPAPHLLPHLPQLFGSFCGFDSQPLYGLLSQLLKPLVHVTSHAPHEAGAAVEHTLLPLGSVAGQAFPQPPQFARVPICAQSVPSQSANPLLHAKVQTPGPIGPVVLQTGAPLAGVLHVSPHPEQSVSVPSRQPIFTVNVAGEVWIGVPATMYVR